MALAQMTWRARSFTRQNSQNLNLPVGKDGGPAKYTDQLDCTFGLWFWSFPSSGQWVLKVAIGFSKW
jgi:hypothetical protein